MYRLSITAAKTSLDLSSAYFVPDDMTTGVLANALKRVVKIRIITPGEIINTDTVRAASRGNWEPLLEAGTEIYKYQPSMYYCKVMIIDTLLVSVGSINFDNRAFRLNDEINLNVYGTKFAKRPTNIFEEDLKNAREITFQACVECPEKEKLMERLALLLRLQM